MVKRTAKFYGPIVELSRSTRGALIDITMNGSLTGL